MKQPLTGGMYSLFRVFLGFWTMLEVLGLWGRDGGMVLNYGEALYPGLGRGLGLVLCLLLCLGKWDRIAGLFLLLFVNPFVDDPFLMPLIHPLSFLLGCHFFVSPKPYGSLEALGRPDPAGGWVPPRDSEAVVWLFMAAMGVASALMVWLNNTSSISARAGISVLGFLSVCAFVERLRPYVWPILVGCFIYLGFLGSQAVWLFVPLLLACLSPSWWPAKVPEHQDYLFYDGMCGLCHRAVRFVMSEDRDGSLFLLTPLQGGLLETRLSLEQIATLPDSMILMEHDGTLHMRSDAAVAICLRLGGWWRPLGWLLRLVPRLLRNACYDGIAAIRKSIFAAPKEMCPVVPVHLRKRFR